MVNLLRSSPFSLVPFSQEDRLKTYKLFKEGNKRILVATDLVGRGIDIERVNIVINYDMPETDDMHGNGADTYLHRVRGLWKRGGRREGDQACSLPNHDHQDFLVSPSGQSWHVHFSLS